jgi:hypothetical protein
VSVEAGGHGLASSPGESLHSAYLYPVGVTKTGFRGNSDNLTSISTVLIARTSNLQ